MQRIQPTISAQQLIQPGYENKRRQLEVVKRDGKFFIELVDHWISNHVVGEGIAITRNNRDVIATIDPCLHQNTPDAARPSTIAGAVARCKMLATEIDVPMSVNLPN